MRTREGARVWQGTPTSPPRPSGSLFSTNTVRRSPLSSEMATCPWHSLQAARTERAPEPLCATRAVFLGWY
jgi:hypothetical protein